MAVKKFNKQFLKRLSPSFNLLIFMPILLICPGLRPEFVDSLQSLQTLIKLYKLTTDTQCLIVECSFLTLPNFADLETDLKQVYTLNAFCQINNLILC